MTTNVSFELAKLLKEKGFREECLFYYNKQGELPDRWESSGSSTDTDVPIYLEEFEANFNSPNLVGVHQIGDVSCSAPTIAEVVMWFYENHEIWISSIPRLSSWIFEIQEIKTGNNSSLIDIDFYGSNDYLKSKGVPTIMQSPIEAYEAAIAYALNNIVL